MGGLWPVRANEVGGLVHPLMVANQSKHTVQFSDLAWDDETLQFPRAWQVGRYLERYRDRYCQDAEIKLSSRVQSAEPVIATHDDGKTAMRWKLIVKSHGGQDETHEVDYLVVATGFFGRPVIPDVPLEQDAAPVVHSSAYRDLPSLLGTTNGKGKKILVVGGQMSGVEIAGTIATHLSSATNSPGPSPIPNPEQYSIHHVIQRPVWVFPLCTSPNVGASLPLSFVQDGY